MNIEIINLYEALFLNLDLRSCFLHEKMFTKLLDKILIIENTKLDSKPIKDLIKNDKEYTEEYNDFIISTAYNTRTTSAFYEHIDENNLYELFLKKLSADKLFEIIDTNLISNYNKNIVDMQNGFYNFFDNIIIIDIDNLIKHITNKINKNCIVRIEDSF